MGSCAVHEFTNFRAYTHVALVHTRCMYVESRSRCRLCRFRKGGLFCCRVPCEIHSIVPRCTHTHTNTPEFLPLYFCTLLHTGMMAIQTTAPGDRERTRGAQVACVVTQTRSNSVRVATRPCVLRKRYDGQYQQHHVFERKNVRTVVVSNLFVCGVNAKMGSLALGLARNVWPASSARHCVATFIGLALLAGRIL